MQGCRGNGGFVESRSTCCRNIFCIAKDVCQADAESERIAADACHGVRNGHARQAGAAIERLVADARHGVRDGHARQAGAAIVFANYFISAICKLNGRKVVT